MTYYVLKVVLTTGLIVAISEVSKRSTLIGGLLASLPLVSFLGMIWLYVESVVGWYHSHPFKLCAECPLPTPPECIAKVLFYSQDDIHLMETTFDQPFMVGLLAAVEPRIEQAVGHLPVKLYGWHSGEIKERGFEVVRAAAH